MSKSSLYIHVGTDKTGTTSIQKFLRDNSSSLSEQVNLPLLGSDLIQELKNIDQSWGIAKETYHPQHVVADYFNNNSSGIAGRIKRFSVLNDINPDFKDLSTGKILQDELDKAEGKSSIISSEVFSRSSINKQEVFETFKSYNPKIVIFLRRQDHYARSLYSQAIKKRVRLNNVSPIPGFKNFIERDHNQKQLDYFSIIEQWSDAGFGDDNIIVVPIEENQNPDFLIKKFCSIVGIKLSQSMYLGVKENISRVESEIEIIRAVINNANITQTRKKWFCKSLGLQETSYKHSHDGTYHLEIKKKLLKDAVFINKKIVTRFLQNEEKSLFKSDHLPDEIEAAAPPTYKMQEDFVRFIFQNLRVQSTPESQKKSA